jgi:hypothetical protein
MTSGKPTEGGRMELPRFNFIGGIELLLYIVNSCHHPIYTGSMLFSNSVRSIILTSGWKSCKKNQDNMLNINANHTGLLSLEIVLASVAESLLAD